MVTRAVIVVAGSILLGGFPAGAARGSGESAPSARKAAVDKATVERIRSERARRKDAEARLRQFRANPPETAPPWMRRTHESSGAAAGQVQAGTRRTP